MTYSIEFCLNMIRHYQAEALNEGKPEVWRALARTSIAEWQHRLFGSENEAEKAYLSSLPLTPTKNAPRE